MTDHVSLPRSAPEAQGATFPRSAPEAQGIASTAVESFLDAVEARNLQLHSVMIVRHGSVVAEGWWTPYGPSLRHLLFSLSKSFTSTAAGLAVGEGLISLDDPVTSFFPDDLPAEISPNLAAMRVRHLLSMATGHAEDTTWSFTAATDGNWVRAFLARPVEREPGSFFLYNTGATYLVAAIVQKVTGQDLLDYLRPRLLEPLGIEDPTWDTCPRGIRVGGWGMSVRTEDIARFGQLYLRKGVWNGKRILSEAWVDAATSRQIENGSDPSNDWNQGYGYQFWRCRHNAYRGDGACGQFCIVIPEHDCVIAITSGTNDLQGVLNAVWDTLLPALGDAPLPEDGDAHAALRDRLRSLSLKTPEHAAEPGFAGTYAFEENPGTLEAVTVTNAVDGGALTVRDDRGEHVIPYSFHEWTHGETTLGQGPVSRAQAATIGSWGRTSEGPLSSWSYAATGAWTSPDTLAVTVCYDRLPFVVTFTCRFDGGRVTFQGITNTPFGKADEPAAEGRLTA